MFQDYLADWRLAVSPDGYKLLVSCIHFYPANIWSTFKHSLTHMSPSMLDKALAKYVYAYIRSKYGYDYIPSADI